MATTSINEIGAIIEGKPYDLAGTLKATIEGVGTRAASESDPGLHELIVTAKSLARQAVDTNASLTRQRSAAITMLERLVCGLTQEAIDAGQIDPKATEPPGYISFFSRVPPGGEPIGMLVRVSQDKRVELVFYRGSILKTPLDIVAAQDVDPELVISALLEWIDGAISKSREHRKQRRLAEAGAIYLKWSEELPRGCVSDPARARAELRTAVETREEFRGGGHPETIDVIIALATLGDDPKEDHRRLTKAVGAWDALNPVPTSRSLHLWAKLAWSCAELHDFEASATWFRRVGNEAAMVVKREGKRLAFEDVPLWYFASDDGTILFGFDKDAKDLKSLDAAFVQREATDFWTRLLGFYSDVTSPTQTHTCAAVGRHGLARVLPLIEGVSPLSARANRNIGQAHYRLGNHTNALAAFARAGDSSVEIGAGAIPEDVAYLAMTYSKLGEADKAKQALDQFRKLMSQTTWDKGGWSADGSSAVGAKSLLAEAEQLIEGTPPKKP